MLAEPHSTHLRALFLYDTNMDPTSMAILCTGLRRNVGLVNLNLGENDIGYEGTEHLIALLTVKPTLYQLYLDWYVTNKQQKREINRLLSANEHQTDDNPVRWPPYRLSRRKQMNLHLFWVDFCERAQIRQYKYGQI